jgi:hypothetical protein
MRIKPLSKICLENNFERGRAGKEFVDKTPNWDSDRIAEVDTIILKMAICEF